jgi:hypothetical protein
VIFIHYNILSYYNNNNLEKLTKMQGRDKSKLEQCKRRGIVLIVIPSKYDYLDETSLRNFIVV